jgi:hypothetical protein
VTHRPDRPAFAHSRDPSSLTLVRLEGGAVAAVQRDATVNWTSASHACACACGVLWSAGIACIAVAVGRFDGQISQLVPLYK